MGAVLDQCDALLGTDLAQSLHVADMAAHVRQQQDFGAAAARLARQIGQVDGVVVAHIDQHRPCPGMGQRTRHRRQRETVGQHRVTRHHTGAFERHKHAGATGVERHAIGQLQLSRKSCAGTARDDDSGHQGRHFAQHAEAHEVGDVVARAEALEHDDAEKRNDHADE